MLELPSCEPGMNIMQPFRRLAGVKATHTVMTSGEESPQ